MEAVLAGLLGLQKNALWRPGGAKTSPKIEPNLGLRKINLWGPSWVPTWDPSWRPRRKNIVFLMILLHGMLLKMLHGMLLKMLHGLLHGLLLQNALLPRRKNAPSKCSSVSKKLLLQMLFCLCWWGICRWYLCLRDICLWNICLWYIHVRSICLQKYPSITLFRLWYMCLLIK